MSSKEERTFEVHPEVYRELQYMVALHQEHGAPNPQASVADLIAFVLASIADGSRRPGCWERSMLSSMGLIADGTEHHRYRAGYGEPPEDE